MGRNLDFIYIGVPKAGSTWLFEALRNHPDVRLFPSKASKHFESETPKPIADYRKQLENFAPGGKVGEISHDAYLYRHNAAILREHFPDVRILVCLREPGDFARSLLQWLQAHTSRYGEGADTMMAHPRLRAWMDFAGGLRRFYDAFPPEQIKVLFFEDFQANPRRFYEDVCAHVGITCAHQPEVLHEVINPARAPRFPVVTHAVFRAGVVTRKLGFGKLVEDAKRWRLLEKVLYSPANTIHPSVLASAMRERERSKAMFDGLERLIGCKLPDQWRQA
jgi:hypothetical protein